MSKISNADAWALVTITYNGKEFTGEVRAEKPGVAMSIAIRLAMAELKRQFNAEKRKGPATAEITVRFGDNNTCFGNASADLPGRAAHQAMEVTMTWVRLLHPKKRRGRLFGRVVLPADASVPPPAS